MEDNCPRKRCSAWRKRDERLKRNHRTRQPHSRAVQKEPHAQRLCAFDGHQEPLAADVVAVLKPHDLGFVVVGIALQPGNPLLNRAAKPRTNLKAITFSMVRKHGSHLG